MLRVFMASGEEALAMAVADFAMEEQPARVLAIKRHLHRLTGQPRFKQRLVLSDGEMLPDDVLLQGPMDLQLVLLPFEASSQRQIWELRQTAGFNNIPAMERFLQRPQDPDEADANGCVALQVACHYGCAGAVRLLMEAKADKDKALHDGATPMFLASQENHLEVVRLLLEANADKDKGYAATGATPLFIASQSNYLEVVRVLLEANADKDKADHTGATPLWMSSQEGHLEVVRVLLEANADKDKADHTGATPLWMASQEGHLEVVRLLLGANADKDKAIDVGATPLLIASHRNHLEVESFACCWRPTLTRTRPFMMAQLRCS